MVRLGHDPMDKQRTKKLQSSFTVQVVPGTNEFIVFNRMKYFRFIEGGTDPHQIAARRVQWLQFRDRRGRWRRVKVVQHPGTPAFRILRDAADLAFKRALGNVRRT